MDTDNNVVAARGKVGGSGGRWRGLIHADGVRFDFRWWAHSAIYRSSITEMHTHNLYDPIDVTPINLIKLFKNNLIQDRSLEVLLTIGSLLLCVSAVTCFTALKNCHC